MAREMTNGALGQLTGALALLTFDSRRATPDNPAQVTGDLTHPALSIRVARAIRELRPAVEAKDAAQQAVIQKYIAEQKELLEHQIANTTDEHVKASMRAEMKMYDELGVPSSIAYRLLKPVLDEKVTVEDAHMKPLTGAILKAARVTLDAGTLIALDWMLVDYEEDEPAPTPPPTEAPTHGA